MTTSSHKVLIVGSGGREFALAERFGADSLVTQVFVVPGNPAIATTVQVCLFAG